MEIKASVQVLIKHLDGPVIEDTDHVRNWLVDEQSLDGRDLGWRYQVCSQHSNPEDCPGGCEADFARYEVMITGAEWDPPEPPDALADDELALYEDVLLGGVFGQAGTR